MQGCDNDDTDSLASSFARTVEELQAIQAIYQDDVLNYPSDEELVQVARMTPTSTLKCTIRLQQQQQYCGNTTAVDVHITLPPGYPISTAAVVYVTGCCVSKQLAKNVSQQLNEHAQSIQGSESILELLHEAQQLIEDEISKSNSNNELVEPSPQQHGSVHAEDEWCRCWIWVHHINDSHRIQSIAREASEVSLRGIVKSGYPGIVVVEGLREDCETYITWIKGNKSRPGGFGRNWGHHVRGQIELSSDTEFRLPDGVSILEQMKDLGSMCKECALEQEFLQFVMQHK